MVFRIDHANINVTDLERSLVFYREALGMQEVRRSKAEDGRFELVFLSDGKSPFGLELTWLRDHPQAYDLGENESHLCFVTDDYDSAHAKHAEMGCICYENETMHLYFINDPDDYWIEIVPERRS